MRYIKGFLVLVIALLAFSQINVNAQVRSVGVAKIKQNVFKELIKLPYYGVFDHISFQVDGNTVTLYGKVIPLGLKKTAEKSVKNIDGVGKVINNIENLPPSRYDDTIRYRTAQTLANDGGSLYRYLIGTNPSIRIIVDSGRVTLEGFVNSKSDASLANVLANQVAGTFSVTNNLQISRGSN